MSRFADYFVIVGYDNDKESECDKYTYVYLQYMNVYRNIIYIFIYLSL